MLTQEQLEARRTTIGASDAAPILGISPFKTALQLWQEKVEGKQQYLNSAMARGNALEPQARQLFFKMTGVYMAESDTQSHALREWQTATPDGITFRRDQILEIKCNKREIHEMARNKQLPDYYMSQVQHQLSVFELDMGYYFSYDGEEGLVVEVKRDNSFIDSMIEKEEAFWRLVMDKTPPSSKELLNMSSLEWEMLVDEWHKLSDLEERKKEIKTKMIEMSGEKDAEGYGIKLQKVTQKGSVDYSLIPELSGVNLEKYRKKPTTFWRVS